MVYNYTETLASYAVYRALARPVRKPRNGVREDGGVRDSRGRDPRAHARAATGAVWWRQYPLFVVLRAAEVRDPRILHAVQWLHAAFTSLSSSEPRCVPFRTTVRFSLLSACPCPGTTLQKCTGKRRLRSTRRSNAPFLSSIPGTTRVPKFIIAPYEQACGTAFEFQAPHSCWR